MTFTVTLYYRSGPVRYSPMHHQWRFWWHRWKFFTTTLEVYCKPLTPIHAWRHSFNRGPILPGLDFLVTSMLMTDVGDKFKVFVTDLRCWWTIKYIEKICQHHLKSVNITNVVANINVTGLPSFDLMIVTGRFIRFITVLVQTPTRFWSLLKIGGYTMTSTRCNT